MTRINTLVDGRQVSQMYWENINFDQAEIFENDFATSLLAPYITQHTKVTHLLTPRWQAEDVLWGKETLFKGFDGMAAYKADDLYCGSASSPITWRWKRDILPSIHMPKEAARLWLPVERVWPERVQEIDVRDVVMEGIDTNKYAEEFGANSPNEFWGWGIEQYGEDIVGEFANLWNSIYAEKAPWESNPWVWATEFRRSDG